MEISRLPLNALRAFEASARLLSFTRAGLELRVTQAAISHQVKSLEALLGVTLFKRKPRGLALTDEGEALLPVLTDGFRRMSATLGRFEEGDFHDVLTVGIVGTFALGWLLPRIDGFRAAHPRIDLRVRTNNNRADILADGLDVFIRFGDGAWHGTEAAFLMEAPLSPFCAPEIAARLRDPGDLDAGRLLRSYRADEWPAFFRAAGRRPMQARGWMFDSSTALAEAAARGMGVALLPSALFSAEIAAGRLARLFDLSIVTGGYWLTWLKSRAETPAMAAFRGWAEDRIAAEAVSGS